MTCRDARDALPLWLTTDLPAGTTADLARHLDGCPACRVEAVALRAVRAALNEAPAPPVVTVDLPRLFREASARQERRLRRWRRVALAVGAGAAALALVVGLRLEVRVGPNQLVVRWGREPAPAPVVAPPVPAPVQPALSAEDEERLRVLQQLVHALAQDLDRREAVQRNALSVWQRQIEALHLRTLRRLEATENDLRALYAARFGPRSEGGGE